MATNLKPQSQELVGQIAIVTGGGRGFGREIARALAQAGAEVAVVARSDDQLSETETLRSAQSDMTGVISYFAAISFEYFSYHVLVNRPSGSYDFFAAKKSSIMG